MPIQYPPSITAPIGSDPQAAEGEFQTMRGFVWTPEYREWLKTVIPDIFAAEAAAAAAGPAPAATTASTASGSTGPATTSETSRTGGVRRPATGRPDSDPMEVTLEQVRLKLSPSEQKTLEYHLTKVHELLEFHGVAMRLTFQ
jgi:hypothetical protein